MKNSFLFSISVSSLLLCIFSGALGWTFQFILVCIVYTLLGGLISLKRLNILQSLVLLLPFILVYSVTWIFIGSKLCFPITLAPFIAFIISFYFTHRQIQKHIYINIIIISLIFVLSGLLGMPNWFSYASNRDAYLRYKFPDLALYYNNGKKFNKEDFIGKVTILDFWHKSCGLCFKQFPEIDDFNKKLDTNQIMLMVVNIPIYDTLEERKELDNMNYTFNKLSLGQPYSKIKDKLNIHGAPIIFVIDPEGYICYKGAFYNKPYILVNNINNIIKKIKKKFNH